MDLLVASIGSLYERAIVDTGRQPELLFFVSFLLSFGFIRTSAHMIRAEVSWWPGNVQVGGTHIHHLVWGIILLLVAGWVSVALEPERPWAEVTAVAFGIGAGLTLDEFALWLHLEDVYWSEQGRRSIDAVIVAATITGMILIGFSAWVDVAKGIEEEVFALVGAAGLPGIALALVNLAKEKFGMAVVGLLVPPVAIAGAFRLGRPGSMWANAFYKEGPKRERARERYATPRGIDKVRERLRARKKDPSDQAEPPKQPPGT